MNEEMKQTNLENEENVNISKNEHIERKNKGYSFTRYIVLTLVLCLITSVISSYCVVKYLNKNRTSIAWHSEPTTNATVVLNDYSPIVEKVENSVVEVYTEKVSYGSFYGSYISEGAGSGVIFTTDGYIITNNHVIDGAETINVKLHNGKSYQAVLVATDPAMDAAVIKIDENGLVPAIIGDSESLKVGQLCLAVGNPLGTLGGTVTAGIISALSRELSVEGVPMNLLQINVSVSPGNSGGGLFNTSGELIGIVNAKSVDSFSEGIGFAIPVNEVIEVAQQLIEKGYVEGRAMLGIQCVSIENVQTAWNYGVNSYGVYVSDILADSLKNEGLEVGDVIVQIGDNKVESLSDLKTALYKFKALDKVKLTVVRGKEKVELEITLIQKQ